MNVEKEVEELKVLQQRALAFNIDKPIEGDCSTRAER